MALSKKGYVQLILGAKNSVNIEMTEKVAEYEAKMGERSEAVLRLLFTEFSEEEMSQFYQLFKKLYKGVELFEKGTDEL